MLPPPTNPALFEHVAFFPTELNWTVVDPKLPRTLRLLLMLLCVIDVDVVVLCTVTLLPPTVVLVMLTWWAPLVSMLPWTVALVLA